MNGVEILAIRAGLRSRRGHRHHRQRLDQPRGRGDARRRLRLPRQAVRRPAAGDGHGTRSSLRLARRDAAEERRRTRRFAGLHRRLGADAGVYRIVEAPLRSRRDGVHHRRERHRQGGLRARRSTGSSPRRDKPFVAAQLRRDPARAAGKRDVRPRQGRLHRRASPTAGRGRAAPTAARCSSTRSARWTLALQTKLLRFLQTGDDPAGRRQRGRSRSTCASSAPPTATRARRCGRPVPRGSVLPAARRADPHAAAARAAPRTCCRIAQAVPGCDYAAEEGKSFTGFDPEVGRSAGVPGPATCASC